MKKRVFVTRDCPGLDSLISAADDIHFNVCRSPEAPAGADLAKHLADCHGCICLLSDEIDERIMNAAPILKVISIYAVGYNNIDIRAAQKKGIAVCNTPDVLTKTTAELAWALLMAAARRIPESHDFVRSGKFTGWQPDLMPGRDVSGKTLGIIGAGRIGSAVAKISRGFEMPVLYSGRKKTDFEKEFSANHVSLDDLLARSDFISIHVPLTDETYHLLGKREFSLMKSEAVLVNTSRGAVINEAELLNALRNGRIAAAGLDVFENEPELTPGLADCHNAVLTPHMGSATMQTRKTMTAMAVDSCVRILRGQNSRFRVV